MKKWTYVTFPVAMMVLFLLFYMQDSKRLDALEKQREAAVAEKRRADDEQRAELQRKAKAESDRRAAEQAAAAAQKEADRIAKWNADTDKIKAQIASANAESADQAAKAKELQDQLDVLQKSREQKSREAFDLTRAVEAARVDQENAELENQRMIEIIANKASQSAMANYTPPPPAK